VSQERRGSQHSDPAARRSEVMLTDEALWSGTAVPRDATAGAEVDRAVVADLHERRGRDLIGFARHLGLADEEAQDAAQETLLRLWVAMDGGQVIGQPDAWAFRTLYRLCMDQHRWRRRVRALTERLAPEPVNALPRFDRADAIAVWQAVERLPDRQRLTLYLRYRADLPYEEIGEILGIAAVSARSQVSRALDALRAAFPDETENAR
jgi:RNA polymerase sigma factor (sigma-70 family)